MQVSYRQDSVAEGLAHASARFSCMKRGKQNNSKAVGTFGLDIREALSLKQDLNVGQAVSQQQILHILQADRHCDGACKSRKDNPSCLCGVVPAAGSFRRKGLWQKEPQGLMHLGANPSDQKRQVCILITSRCAKILHCHCCFCAEIEAELCGYWCRMLYYHVASTILATHAM